MTTLTDSEPTSAPRAKSEKPKTKTKAVKDTGRDYQVVSKELHRVELRLAEQRAAVSLSEAELEALIDENVALIKAAGKKK